MPKQGPICRFNAGHGGYSTEQTAARSWSKQVCDPGITILIMDNGNVGLISKSKVLVEKEYGKRSAQGDGILMQAPEGGIQKKKKKQFMSYVV